MKGPSRPRGQQGQEPWGRKGLGFVSRTEGGQGSQGGVSQGEVDSAGLRRVGRPGSECPSKRAGCLLEEGEEGEWRVSVQAEGTA